MLWMRPCFVFVLLLSSIVLACAGGRRSPVEPGATHLGLGHAAASEKEYSAALPQGEPGVELPKKLSGDNPRGPSGMLDTRAEVKLDVVIRVDGTVGIYRVARATEETFARSCVEAVTQWRFSPARKDRKPVAVRGEITCMARVYR